MISASSPVAEHVSAGLARGIQASSPPGFGAPPAFGFGALPPAFGLGFGEPPPQAKVNFNNNNYVPEANDFQTNNNKKVLEFQENPPYREEYIPIGDRDDNEAKENDGKNPKRYFVFLPKITKETPLGTLNCIQIPVGTKFYKAMTQAEFPVACKHVNDPSKEACVQCLQSSWFGDYIMALNYSKTNPTSVGTFCFEATKEFTLVNLMDKRNLDKIIKYYIDKISAGETQHKFELGEFTRATGYTLSEEMKAVLQEKGLDIPLSLFTPDEKPPAKAELEAEFGPQSQLKRDSYYISDLRMLNSLKRLDLGVEGYYAPTYRGFPREIALFKTKGFMRHAKEDPRNGCSVQAAVRQHLKNQRNANKGGSRKLKLKHKVKKTRKIKNKNKNKK